MNTLGLACSSISFSDALALRWVLNARTAVAPARISVAPAVTSSDDGNPKSNSMNGMVRNAKSLYGLWHAQQDQPLSPAPHPTQSKQQGH